MSFQKVQITFQQIKLPKFSGFQSSAFINTLNKKRLPAFRAGNVILLQKEAVEQFKPNISGRQRKKAPLWRVYRGRSEVLVTDILVRVRPGKQAQMIEKLKAIYRGQRYTFPGTIQHYILKDGNPPTTVSIWLIWKDTKMPDEITRQRNLEAFRTELDDTLDWETAQISTREGIIYT